MREIEKHKLYYLFLTLILAFGVILVIFATPNRALQGTFIVLTGVSYFIFGVVHHVQNHDFHPKIVVEYGLIASLGITCGLFMLKVGLGL